MQHKNNLISIYKVPDEITGITLKSLLEKEGIETVLQSSQIPWYDGIMKTAKGYWGEILLREKDKERAETTIKDYLKTDKEEES